MRHGILSKGSLDSNFSTELDALLVSYHKISPEDSGQRDALRNKIVEFAIPYVKKIAHGIARRTSDPVEDLMQVGNIGLMKAIDKYKPNTGTSFKTYCTYLITGEMRHYLRDKANMIKPPRQIYELYYRLNQVVHTLTERLGRPPSDLELAEELQCPLEKVEQVQESERRRQVYSLATFLVGENDKDSMYVEQLVDEKQQEFLEQQETKMVLDTAMAQLKVELQDVVRLSYFEDLSQTEIAEQLGISQMQVSRRLKKALDTLSSVLKDSNICLNDW